MTALILMPLLTPHLQIATAYDRSACLLRDEKLFPFPRPDKTQSKQSKTLLNEKVKEIVYGSGLLDSIMSCDY